MSARIKQIDNKPYKNRGNYHLDLSIKDVDVESGNVLNVVIREWYNTLIPTLELTIQDDGKFTDKYPLEDNDEIKINLGLNKEDEPLIATFLVESWTMDRPDIQSNDTIIFKIFAVLKTNSLLYPIRNRSFGFKKSSDIISQIASEIGLTPDIRIATNDVMPWLQVNESNSTFLKSMINHSYFQEDDLVLVYTQSDSKLVVTSLKTELNNKKLYQSKYDVNETVNSDTDLFGVDKESDGNRGMIHFMNYSINNMSPIINKLGGYGSQLSYNKDGEEQIINFTNDEHPMSLNSFKLKDKIGLVTYQLTERSLSVNMHPKYLEANVQNRRLRNEYFSSYISLDIKPNFSVKLGERVKLELPGIFTKINDMVHSGEYIIGGIVYEANQGSTICNQRLILFRNGINNKLSSMEDFETKLS